MQLTQVTDTLYVQEKIIHRAPHGINVTGVWTPSPVYLIYREKVLYIMANIFQENAAWTFVKLSHRSLGGCNIYQDIFNHFIGPNNIDNLATAANLTLSKTIYEGYEKRWNFERYVNTPVRQNPVLQGLVQYIYSRIDK